MFGLTLAAPLTKIIMALSLVATLFSGGLYIGYQWGSKSLPEAVVKQERHFTKTLTERWQINSDSVPIYLERIQKVKGDTQQLLTQVPVYVPQNTCTLPSSVRMLHDSATQGHLPVAQQGNDGVPQAPQDTPR